MKNANKCEILYYLYSVIYCCPQSSAYFVYQCLWNQMLESFVIRVKWIVFSIWLGKFVLLVGFLCFCFISPYISLKLVFFNVIHYFLHWRSFCDENNWMLQNTPKRQKQIWGYSGEPTNHGNEKCGKWQCYKFVLAAHVVHEMVIFTFDLCWNFDT